MKEKTCREKVLGVLVSKGEWNQGHGTRPMELDPWNQVHGMRPWNTQQARTHVFKRAFRKFTSMLWHKDMPQLQINHKHSHIPEIYTSVPWRRNMPQARVHRFARVREQASVQRL